MQNTVAEVGIEFNPNSTSAEIPPAADVAQTLVDAVNNPNSTLNITIQANTVRVVETPALNTTAATTTPNATTTTAPTTRATTTEAPPPVVAIQATLVEVFVPELSDRNSQQFRALETRVVTVCDIIYFVRYGAIFRRTFIIAFRSTQMQNTVAEVGIEFNPNSTSAEIPPAADVAQTLVDAVNNPNSTLNITIQANTVRVVETPALNTTAATTTPNATTTTAPTTRATTTEAPPPVVAIQATLVEVFVPELSDRNSQQFRALETRVVTVCDIIYFVRYGAIFRRTFIIAFRSTQMQNTVAEVGIEFNPNSTSAEIPPAADVAQTLVDAVNNPNSTLNITIQANTVRVVETPALNTTAATTTPNATTTTAPTTRATTTEAPPPVVAIQATLVEVFVPELSDRNSQQFRALETRVVTVCDIIYFVRYGAIFRRTFIIAFRSTQMQNTVAEVGIEFNPNSTSAEIPPAADVAQTLVDAVNNPNSTLNITIQANTVRVVETPALNTTAATTTPNATTTTAPTTRATTTEAPPPVVAIQATLVEVFVPELSDRNSQQFRALETRVVTVCDIIYFVRYGAIFRRTFIIAFRSTQMQNTVAEVGIEFNPNSTSAEIPPAADVAQTLVDAVNNPNSTLNITIQANTVRVVETPALNTTAATTTPNATTTTAPTTRATTTEAPPPVVAIQATLVEVFVPELSDRNSQQFRALETRVVTVCDIIYFVRYGAIFRRTFIIAFRSTQMQNTVAEVGIEFNPNSTSAEIPPAADVAQTLVDAVNNPNSTLNITIQANTVRVVETPALNTTAATTTPNATTTTAPTTRATTTEAPPPVVAIQATLVEVFVPELSDRNSQQFRALETRVVTVCDIIYFVRYGAIFRRTFIIAFRSTQMQNTVAEVGIEFNPNSTSAEIPPAADVAQTLVDAVNNPNSTLNITIQANTVRVVETTALNTTAATTTPNATTTTAPTTRATTTEAPPPVVAIQATLVEVFVPELSDRNSQQFRALETRVVTVCDIIYFVRYGAIFRRTFIIAFRSTQMQNTVAEVGIEFNPNSTSAEIPPAADVAQTLVDAVNNPNSTLNITIQANTVRVVETPALNTTAATTTPNATTTTAPTTRATTTEAPPPVVAIQATLVEVFVPELSDRNSQQFRALETRVVTVCDIIYFVRYGAIFRRTFIIAFRSTQMQNTVAEVGIEFNPNSTSAEIPPAADVAQTLVDAVNNPNSTLNITIQANTVRVVETPALNTTAATTTPNATTTTAPTTRATTTEAPPPVVAIQATLVEVFVPELSDRNSQQFRALETRVVTVCDIIYFVRYGAIFRRTFIIAFRSTQMQNTVAEVGIEFNPNSTSAEIPPAADVAQTLVDAVNNPNSTLNITIQANTVRVVETTALNTTAATTTPNATTTTAPTTRATTTEAPPQLWLFKQPW
ncbi:mucin-5AC-like [Mugil cephalus]|uniref:mucin-5AC-like n=1 Tax=Mugil cephalus TaxID=48193 RepID=UPI001FB807AF|nr:mucin-5AC-like [Mugil cephalus]